MSNRARFIGIFSIISSFLLVGGCSSSSGPERAKPGTPAYFWAAANETFKNGDHAKTSTHLSKLVQGKNEFSTRAQVWQIVVEAGRAQGYMDLAERFSAGVKASRGNMELSKQVSNLRNAANASALQLTELLHGFMDANKDAEIVFAMPVPPGSPTEASQVQRIAKGIMPPEEEVASIERAMVQRGVLLSAARMMGTGDDVAKATQMLKQGEGKVPREAFLRGTAQSLWDNAQLYLPNKLDQPKRLQVLCQEATEALAGVSQTKEDKELTKKIQDTLKKYKLQS